MMGCLPFLAESVRPILCLFIVVWVEVNIVNNNVIGSREVDTEATGSSGDHKQEEVRVGVILVYQSEPGEKKPTSDKLKTGWPGVGRYFNYTIATKLHAGQQTKKLVTVRKTVQ